jgi:hypothetical protein
MLPVRREAHSSLIPTEVMSDFEADRHPLRVEARYTWASPPTAGKSIYP